MRNIGYFDNDLIYDIEDIEFSKHPPLKQNVMFLRLAETTDRNPWLLIASFKGVCHLYRIRHCVINQGSLYKITVTHNQYSSCSVPHFASKQIIVT